jgi:hypothetical protein
MTALYSKISRTIGTLNLTVGCDSLSAACDNCHARRHVGRRAMTRGRFTRKPIASPASPAARSWSSICARSPGLIVANRNSDTYAQNLAHQRAVECIADATGSLGTCAEYLFETVAHLVTAWAGPSEVASVTQRAR